jgi:Xaa-Pro dipeptidase
VRPYGDFDADTISSTRSPLGAAAAFKRALSKQKGSPSEALLSLLDERGISSGRIGVELGNISLETKTALKKLRNVEVLDSSELIRFVRMVKTKEEVLRLQDAARITEKAIQKSVGAVKRDGKMATVSGVFRTELAKQGAALEHWSFGIDGLGLTDDGTAPLRKGVYLSHDVGCIYRMYFCDTGTTIVVGNQKDVVSTHRSLFQIIDENLDSLRAGSSPSSIMRSYATAYKRRGLKNVNYQLHGIGLETREHPVIAHSKYKRISDDIVSASTEIPLESGMVMNIETPLDHPGKGSFQVERTFLITNKEPVEITPRRDGYPLLVN